jgi:hypothetical protein
MDMFSTNPYTRRRQQVVTGFASISGIVVVLCLASALRARPALPAAVTPTVTEVERDSFGRIALSPDGTRQAELSGGQVILRDRQTQRPLAIFTQNNVKGVRFTPGGSELLVHLLRKQSVPGSELEMVSDYVVVLDPLTGSKRGEGSYTIRR